MGWAAVRPGRACDQEPRHHARRRAGGAQRGGGLCPPAPLCSRLPRAAYKTGTHSLVARWVGGSIMPGMGCSEHSTSCRHTACVLSQARARAGAAGAAAGHSALQPPGLGGRVVLAGRQQPAPVAQQAGGRSCGRWRRRECAGTAWKVAQLCEAGSVPASYWEV